MKQNTNLDNLHIGKMIKEIANQKGVPAKEIANLIRRYEKNAGKIYCLKDMYVDDVVKISSLLEYNILDFIAKKYLSHLPFPNAVISTESRLMKFDIENRKITIYNPLDDCSFLENVNIGQRIRRVVKKKGWTEQYLSEKLNCRQNNITDLYRRSHLKVKNLIFISNVLQYNFIAEAYLSQMTIIFTLNLIDGCTIALHLLPQVYIKNPNDETFSIIFKQNEIEK
jgi:transcriptional regulator with XRE-family HTH domain